MAVAAAAAVVAVSALASLPLGNACAVTLRFAFWEGGLLFFCLLHRHREGRPVRTRQRSARAYTSVPTPPFADITKAFGWGFAGVCNQTRRVHKVIASMCCILKTIVLLNRAVATVHKVLNVRCTAKG